MFFLSYLKRVRHKLIELSANTSTLKKIFDFLRVIFMSIINFSILNTNQISYLDNYE